MSTLKIGLVSVASVGGVAGTVVLVKHFSPSEKQDVRNRLINEKFELLNDSHSAYWKTSLDKYNGKKSSEAKSIDETQLKSICKSFLSKDKGSEEDYKKAKRYCVVPQNVSTRLSKLNLTALTTADNSHQQQWTALAASYVTKRTDSNQIESLVLRAGNSGQNNWSQLRDKCKVVIEKDHWEDDFDTYLEKAKMWCTIQAATPSNS